MARLPKSADFEYVVYCDGASRKDGRGGWGVSLRYGNRQKDICGGEYDTTNNRMELIAAMEGLKLCPKEAVAVVVSDSQYVIKGVTEYLPDWKQRGWRTGGNKPVANTDLWQEMEEVISGRVIVWEWVKGHTGHPGNERADYLAGLGVPPPRRTH